MAIAGKAQVLTSTPRAATTTCAQERSVVSVVRKRVVPLTVLLLVAQTLCIVAGGGRLPWCFGTLFPRYLPASQIEHHKNLFGSLVRMFTSSSHTLSHPSVRVHTK